MNDYNDYIYHPVVGDTIITKNSKTEGEVLEVVANKSGSWRVRIDTGNGERWATVGAR